MGTRVRAAAAVLALLAACASPGLAATASSAAVPSPTGGCWAYQPSDVALDAPPAADLSTELEPWTTVEDGGFELTTSGATAVGGTRTVTSTVTSGPVVSDDVDVSGTASFLFSVDGTPLADPVAVPFSAAAGEPVEGLIASTTLPVDAAGDHTVELAGVYFDDPVAGVRLACNGQSAGAPGGPNPATDPMPTDLTADFTATAAASATIAGIDDQVVLTSARTGDAVTLSLTGLASSAAVAVDLCDATGTCSPIGGATTAADGTATASVIVPSGAPVGAGTLRVDDGTTQVSAPLTVLGAQTVTAGEKLTRKTTLVSLAGTGWDPERPVTISGYAGDSSSAARTTDAEVSAEVDANGEFSATYEIADADTESVIVDQARAASNIGSVYLISGVIGGGGKGPGDNNGDNNGDDNSDNSSNDDGDSDTGDAGSTTTGTTTVTTPTTASDSGVDTEAPPNDIPLPGEVPIKNDPGGTTPPVTPEQVEDLAVSEVHLEGHASLGELFGGAPQRDLVFLVENAGDDTVENPIVRVAVGRSEDLEPEAVDVPVGTLEPGDQAVVTVPIELPIAAFGTYRVVGQVGDSPTGGFELEWTTYPWGLFVLNALAAVLLALGIRHRVVARRPAPYRPAPAAGEAVVDMAAAQAWWAYRSRGGRPAAPAAAAATPVGGVAGPAFDPASEPVADEAVVDLDAAEQWWARRAAARGSQAS